MSFLCCFFHVTLSGSGQLNLKYTYTSAYNLTQAKRLLLGDKFDLVMLDGEAGNGWGYEIIPDILKNNSEAVIITSSNYDSFNVKNIEMGCHESVNKTFLYEWNDAKSEYRTQKGKVITDLFKSKLHKKLRHFFGAFLFFTESKLGGEVRLCIVNMNKTKNRF